MRLAGAASLRPRPGCYSQLRSSAAAKEGPSSSPRLIAPRSSWEAESASEGSSVTFFCCGDFMTGRGVDQILPFRSDPQIYEKHMKDARGYVRNAEQRIKPDVRIINLETAITTSNDWWKDKGINYRMHPGNVPALSEAKVDVCVLANNHVLDWGYQGLKETLNTLQAVGISTSGAGENLGEATAPAIKVIPGKGRVLVFAHGTESAGVPRAWAAGKDKPGVALLDLADRHQARSVRVIKEQVVAHKQPGDVVVLSIHWGSNWGFTYEGGPGGDQVTFAHRLIEECEVDVVHGHSSHHVKGIEVHRGKLIMYGCGDFLNDYEGIMDKSLLGYNDRFRHGLSFMYFVTVNNKTGALKSLRLKATRIKNLRVNTLDLQDNGTRLLVQLLNREGERFGTSVDAVNNPEGLLGLSWHS